MHCLADNDLLTQTQNCKVDFNRHVETVMAEVELSSTLTLL